MPLINLGLIKAIFVQTTAPINTNVIWKDTSSGGAMRYYDSTSSSWLIIGSTSGTVISTAHLVGIGSSPTIAANTGAGTGAVVGLTNATDLDGMINLTPGTSPSAGQIFTITFSIAFAQAPNVTFSNANSNSASPSFDPHMYVNTTTTQAKFFTTSAISTGIGYAWTYHVAQ